MSFIRPEARAGLWRIREMLAGGGLTALGSYWALGFGLLSYIGYAVAAFGVALTIIGWQRFRFRGAGGGPGVVRVDEGQIAYFGPLTGGVVALSELEVVSLDGAVLPQHWILTTNTGETLQIPVNAEGVEALFDVFTALPGMRTERMLAELRAEASASKVLWQRRETAPQRRRLH